MKKGANPAILFMIMDDLISDGHDVKDINFKAMVMSQYNAIHKVPSTTTKISNLREEALLEFQDKLEIIKLSQDGNGVDFCAYKKDDRTIKIIVSQQKGNNASLNGGGKKGAISSMKEFIDEKKIEQYFHLLPDDLNPDKTGYEYEIECIFGYFLATGYADFNGIPVITNNDYLRRMGITDKTIVDLDRWVVDNLKIEDYDAVSKCSNFDEIYNECISKY